MSETTETVTVDATSTTTGAPTTTAPAKDEPLGEAGKLALVKERETREAAEKRAKTAAGVNIPSSAQQPRQR